MSASAFAQGAGPAQPPVPATDTTLDEMPALDTQASSGDAAKNPADDKRAGEAGTTIVGDNSESPIGLYITPWRSSHAEKGIDRPARLLQEQMLPIDEAVFKRQVQYYEALTAAAEKKAAH
ncbi:MAG TPA: hypothetical protein VN046_10890 [Stenotrophobium sp.]|nr:hypothetical protein [Stenotrophobium sp.]